jgi:hypothetical protein
LLSLLQRPDHAVDLIRASSEQQRATTSPCVLQRNPVCPFSYTVYRINLTNITGHILPDTQNAPRGIAIKVFGVDGDKMKESNPEKGGWHDIFMNNAPILEVSSAVNSSSVLVTDDQTLALAA